MVLKNFKKLKLIAVSTENYEKIRCRGNTPDSFNTIISRMLKEIEMLESESRVRPR